MELMWEIISILILFITTIIIFHKFGSNTITYPPGSTGWPLFGENLDYFFNFKNGQTEKFVMNRTNKHSSEVFKTSLMGEKVAVFSGPECNKFLFSNENKLFHTWWPSSVDRIFPKSNNKTTFDESIKVRKMLPAFLKPAALKNYIDIMDSEMIIHVNTHWLGYDRVKAERLARKYTFELACRLFLGLTDAKNIDKLLVPFEYVEAGIISMPLNFPGTAFYKAVNASRVIRKGIVEIIRKKKFEILENNVKSKDILSHMLQEAYTEGHVTNDEDIAVDLLGLLVAGHDTLTSAITFSIMYLAENPEVYQQVLKEQSEIANTKEKCDLLNWEDLQKMRYTWNVACEALRMRGPNTGGFKVATTDFTYAGHMIPKGWKLHYLPNFTHKNAKYFPNPEKFDPSRFEGTGPQPYTFVPFGGGPRMCPGNEYARAGILVFMHNVVTKFRWEKLVPNEEITNGLFPSTSQGLPILLHPHNA